MPSSDLAVVVVGDSLGVLLRLSAAALDWRLQLTKEILDSRSLCTARQVGAFITADSGHVTAGLEDLACLRYGSDIVISTPNRNAPAARPLYICFQSIADRMKGMCRR